MLPACANLRHHAGDLFDGAGGPVDIGRPQLGGQQMTAAEDVQRQVAIAIIVAVEEPPFLVPVQRIVGGVEIEDDLLGRSPVGIQEKRDE